MSRGEKELPKGWKWISLSECANPIRGISFKGGTAQKEAFENSIPCLRTSNIQNQLDLSDLKFIPKKLIPNVDRLVSVGDTLVSLSNSKDLVGKVCFVNLLPEPMTLGTFILALRPNKTAIIAEYLFYYLASFHVQSKLRALARQTTNIANLSVNDLLNILIPIPPLPVQEQIVQILQKADEIRRKRQEAVAIADATILSIFNEMFNGKDWLVDELGNHLKETRYGTSQKLSVIPQGYPVLRIPNVIGGEINTENMKYLAEIKPDERNKLILKKGAILLVRTNGNRDYVGRCAVFDLPEDYLFASYLIRLRTQDTIDPYFLVFYLNTANGRREIDLKTRTSAGQYNINTENIRSIKIYIPPIKTQRRFLTLLQQWKVNKSKLVSSLEESANTFNALLSQAFTGELTAEWEATNAEQIATKQKFYQRLPQLVILSFLNKKISHIQRQKADTAVLVTALMKYIFLFQMEGAAKRRLYQFIPYHYGPFAKELYTDLETLQEQGLITVDDSDEDKTRISLLNSKEVEAELAELPDDLQVDIQAIIDSYGDLDLTSLLETVYEKYPAYAKKSKLKQRKTKAKKEEN